MRLTLRTMLAYLDEILEPNDHADIGNKIKGSEFARELVDRVRDVIRRPRLAAPPVLGRGIGQDANSAAEYLDNTMPADQVAEFEKVCLESDAQLAEAAASHQVLTLVLGRPADVSQVSRERMYRIPELMAQQTEAAVANQPVTPPPVVKHPTPPLAPSEPALAVVPDYLRESARSRRRARLAWLVLLLALVGAAVATAFWAGWFDSATAEEGGLGESPRWAAERASAPPLVEPGLPAAGLEQPELDSPSTLPEANEEPAGEGGLEPVDEGILPLRLPEVAEQPGELEPPGPEPTGSLPMADAETPEVAETPDGVPMASGAQVGIFVSGEEVLLRQNSQTGDWQRLPPREAIRVGDRLLALPTFRPTISLSDGRTLQLDGGTVLTLQPGEAGQGPSLALQYGRLLVIGGAQGGPCRLLVDQQEVQFQFGESNTTVAVEVRRRLVDGADPEAEPASVVAQVYVANGMINWPAPDEAVMVKAPASWGLTDDVTVAEQPVESLPAWIDMKQLSLTENRASQALAALLQSDRSIALSLAELVEGRRLEVRGLAVRCSVHIGQFGPFVTALADTDQRGMWSAHVETLRHALALDPSVATQVRQAFLRKRGAENGEALYRMLWSYSDQQLIDGADEQLVAYLDHEYDDFRVLAFWNLKHVTGKGPEYRPEFSPTRHQHSVRRWKERLEAGQIRHPGDAS